MRNIIFLVIIIFSATLISCNSESVEKESAELLTYEDTLIYCLGANLAYQLTSSTEELGTPDALAQGFDDFIKGEAFMIEEDERMRILGEFNNKMQMKQREQMMQTIQRNINECSSFLMENKKKEGVIELPSGLQYKVIKEGNGAKPTLNDSVLVHYKGQFADGTVFQSSYDAGTPITLFVSGVIPGWTEGLQNMKIGGIHELYIPYNLAYGEQGRGMIPGGKLLIFQLELLAIK